MSSGEATHGGRLATARRRGERALREALASFAENDLLSYASAIAFQVLFALVPLALAGIAFLGFFDLTGVWRADLRPTVRENLSPEAFAVVDRTIEQILGRKRGLWLTFGLAFALWQVSGAVRATMGPLNAIYHDREDRPFLRRLAVSLALALAIGPLVVLAVVAIHLGPELARRLDLGAFAEVAFFVARWGLAAGVLLLAVWLLLRFGPAHVHTVRWAGLGAVIVVGGWIAASLVFGWYATAIADYQSVFGGLASVIVLMTYLYISTITLLVGVQLDACVRSQAREGEEGQG